MLHAQHGLRNGLLETPRQPALCLRSLRSRSCRPLHQAVSDVASVGADAKKIERTAYKGSEAAGILVDVDSLQKDIRRKAEVIVGRPDVSSLTPEEAYRAVAHSVRDALLDAFFKTQDYWQ